MVRRFDGSFQRAKALSCVILTVFFCGYYQRAYAGQNSCAMGGQRLPELSSVVTRLEEMVVDPAFSIKKLVEASEPLKFTSFPSTVPGRLSPFLTSLKNIQAVAPRRALHAPSPFKKIVERGSDLEKVQKASFGKRDLKRVHVRKSEVVFLPAAQFEASGTSISHDGQWMVVAWRSHRIVSIHNLACPDESYGVDYSSVFGMPVNYIPHVEMAPDNKAMTIILGFADGHSMAVVDLENATVQIPQSVRGLSPHRDSGRFSPDGTLITAHFPKTSSLQVIDWRNNKVLYHTHTADNQFYSAVFEDNDTLLFTSKTNVYRLGLKSNIRKRLPFQRDKTLSKSDFIFYAGVSSGGRWIVALKHLAACIYSRKTGKSQLEIDFRNTPILVTSVDDKILYAVERGKIVGTSLETGQMVSEYVVESAGVSVLKISSDGKTLIAGYKEGLIRFWDISTGQVSLQLEHRSGDIIKNIWLTPDHKYLVSSAHDGRFIEVWRLHVNESTLSALGSSLKDMVVNACATGDIDIEEMVLDRIVQLRLDN